MKSTTEVLTEISSITRDIQENYPELQKYLDETRITLPKAHGNAEEQELKDYLESLREMVNKYKKEH